MNLKMLPAKWRPRDIIYRHGIDGLTTWWCWCRCTVWLWKRAGKNLAFTYKEWVNNYIPHHYVGSTFMSLSDVFPCFHRIFMCNRVLGIILLHMQKNIIHVNIRMRTYGHTSLQWRRMTVMASQFTGNSIICSIAFSGGRQWNHQSCAPLDFVTGTHQPPVDPFTKDE